MLHTLVERPTVGHAREFIVCGWYTQDYRHWWNTLRKNLDEIGAPHDFVEVRKSDGGWEANTMRKPQEILAAMDRHPDTTIIFIDVDCTVVGGYAGLSDLALTPGDVGFLLRSVRRKDEMFCRARSGTLVINPTRHARAFIEAWCNASDKADRFAVDQDSMIIAMASVPGLTITCLDRRYCAIPRDKIADPVILHDQASDGVKVGKWVKRMHRIKPRVLQRKDP